MTDNNEKMNDQPMTQEQALYEKSVELNYSTIGSLRVNFAWGKVSEETKEIARQMAQAAIAASSELAMQKAPVEQRDAEIAALVKKNEALPCPFCGKPSGMLAGSGGLDLTIGLRCEPCGIVQYIPLDKWNTRASRTTSNRVAMERGRNERL